MKQLQERLENPFGDEIVIIHYFQIIRTIFVFLFFFYGVASTTRISDDVDISTFRCTRFFKTFCEVKLTNFNEKKKNRKHFVNCWITAFVDKFFLKLTISDISDANFENFIPRRTLPRDTDQM